MYSKNEIILYGSSGICRIIDVRLENFGDDSAKLYYVLKPVYKESSTLFVPVDNDNLTNRIRHILSADEIQSMLESSSADNTVEWISDKISRSEKYRNILIKGERRELFQLIRLLYMHKAENTEQGRKFYLSDEKLLVSAEKMLCEEFAFVLGINSKEVASYIEKRAISINENNE
jgi:CarD family transcriptional regulator